MSRRSFSPALFAFLRDLREHNDRDWFQANKGRYEDDVREPALEFVSDLAPALREISPHFVADPRPSGGSLFRIHRDIRFSRDKSPYKTHVGISFRHERGKDAHAPVFYLHLEPRSSFVGVGIWRPDGSSLRRIRDALVADPDRWRRVTGEESFSSVFRLEGERLKRPPAGYDPDHPLIEDLKRKDFIAAAGLGDRTVASAGFLDEYADLCRRGAPFVRFLCDAVGVPF